MSLLLAGGAAPPEPDLAWLQCYQLEDWLDDDVLDFLAQLIEPPAQADLVLLAEGVDVDAEDDDGQLLGQLYFDEPLHLAQEFDEQLEDDDVDLPAQIIEDAAVAADDVIQALFDEIEDVDAEIEDLLTQLVPDAEPPPTDGAKWPVPGGQRKRRRKPVRLRDLDRLPEDIAREQRETEEYLRSLERPAPRPAPGVPPALSTQQEETAHRVAPAPQLADRAARTAGELLDAQNALEQRERMRKRRLLILLALLD